MESVLDQIEVNYWAVLVAGVASFILGAVWYKVFATPWMQAVGLKKSDADKFNKGLYIIALAAFLLIAYVMAHVVSLVEVDDVASGISTGVWMWIGFVATTLCINILFQMRTFKLFLIDGSYYLLTFALTGAILGGWLP